MPTSLPRAGYSVIAGGTDLNTARAVIAAAVRAGVDPGLIDYSIETGGYVVPTAVVAAYTGPDTSDDYLEAAFNGQQVAALARLTGSLAATYVPLSGAGTTFATPAQAIGAAAGLAIVFGG